MKKSLLICSALFIASLTINAQDTKPEKHEKGAAKANHPEKKRTPEERASKEVEHLNNVAGLSEDQKTKVKDLALAKVQKMDAIREKYKGLENIEEAKKEMKVVRKDYRQSIKGVLTPEQLEKVKQKAEEKQKEKQSAHPKADKPKPQQDEIENKILDGKE